jgi:hypothetical protein
LNRKYWADERKGGGLKKPRLRLRQAKDKTG